MDSSHTHNTGTAHFVNEYMSPVPPQLASSPYNNPDKLEKVSLSIDDIKTMNANQTQYDTGKQVNRVDKVQQAIEGFPILIEYSYYDDNGELHQEQKVFISLMLTKIHLLYLVTMNMVQLVNHMKSQITLQWQVQLVLM